MHIARSSLTRLAAAVFGSGVLAAVLAVATPAPAIAQGGAFVIRLGRDTSAVERYSQTANRIEADAVVRQPRTTLRHFVVDLGPDGRPVHAELTVFNPGSTTPTLRQTITVRQDSIIAETRRDTAVQRRAQAAPAGTMLTQLGGSASSFVTYDLVAQRLRNQSGSDSVKFVTMNGQTWWAGRLGRDSIWIFDGNDRYHMHVDGAGHILHANPLSGTQQFTAERVASVDINALATAFGARDQQGQSFGLASPRDTVRSSAGGANLLVDYSRPSKRGRVIFGSTIVPWGEVWRTGANAATQFRTDKALEIGGIVVPAGFYTLWTIPSPTGWKLLINSETGQWGTAHKADHDLFQLDMAATTLPQPVERFVISIVPSAQGGTLNLDWDTTRASIPFTVRQ
jgi:hypothetical protein